MILNPLWLFKIINLHLIPNSSFNSFYMKISIIITFSLLISFCTHAQKIKLKKGDIYINKLKVGHVKKVKTATDNYYQFKDTKGVNFCRAKQTFIPSLLFKGDKEYPHRFFYADKIKDTLTIIQENYWLNPKRAAEYLSKIGLLNTKGFVMDSIAPLIATTPKYPQWIQENIEQEKALTNHIDYKITRTINDSLVLKEQTQIQTSGQLKRLPSKVTRIDIYQKNGEEEILIGYGLHEIQDISGYQYYYIFNMKDVPLSFFDTFKYKIYYPYQEFGITGNKLRNITSYQNIILEMALDLVKSNKL